MQLKQLLSDDDAVSPVIGVILMVAITVILAAVIATFVLGLGEQVSETAPNASFNFDYDQGSTTLDITHSGGPNIDVTQLSITGTSTSSFSIDDWPSSVSAGDTETISPSAGETVRIVWENQDGSESSVLQSFNVPS